MKKLTLLAILFSPLLIGNVFGQADNNDTNVASHAFNVNVPELALIDIWDDNTGAEAALILFDLSQIALVGTSAEAGLYYLDAMNYTDIYLNYTSVTGETGGGFDVTRQIDVKFTNGSTWPANLDLRITPEVPVITPGGGDTDSSGSITAGGVALGTTTSIGTDALLVNNIRSVYTGDQNFGVRLTYSLEQNGNFAAFKAGLYQTTIQYTISDI